jgi:hypothetical protein
MNRYRIDLTDTSRLWFQGEQRGVETWQGHKALRLFGLAVVPGIRLSEGSVEVRIAADDVSYCGIAFRIRDSLNYELAYAQPHTSGRWDALQYDPVMNGVNTWQIYHGSGAQKQETVPMGDWFRFRVDFKDGWSAILLNDGEPLVVPKLAHIHRDGFIGIWCYKPAWFRDLVVSDRCEANDVGMPEQPPLPEGLVKEWFLEGIGKAVCEDNGIVNLGRYLPSTVTEARLRRTFTLGNDGDVTLRFGCSDEISIIVDGETVCEARNLFAPDGEWNGQGYVSFNRERTISLPAGEHQLELAVRRTEPFGFGFIFAIEGDGVAMANEPF